VIGISDQFSLRSAIEINSDVHSPTAAARNHDTTLKVVELIADVVNMSTFHDYNLGTGDILAEFVM
jgi:hypothetical protein